MSGIHYYTFIIISSITITITTIITYYWLLLVLVIVIVVVVGVVGGGGGVVVVVFMSKIPITKYRGHSHTKWTCSKTVPIYILIELAIHRCSIYLESN